MISTFGIKIVLFLRKKGFGETTPDRLSHVFIRKKNLDHGGIKNIIGNFFFKIDYSNSSIVL